MIVFDSSMRDANPVSYLAKGIYDIAEVARLIRTGRTRVEGWTRPTGKRTPLLTGQLAGLLSFWDLISLKVVAELVARGVARDRISRGAGHLALVLETDRPFAHRNLATVGAEFFADIDGGWEDVGHRGQQVFQSVIGPLLKPISFNESDMAAVWRPRDGVWINPEVQAGTPCVDLTRVPTLLIADRLGTGDSPDADELAEVCDDYQLTTKQVRDALAYELDLAA
ncbi:MAG: DUF433 domain-containing protein [Acidimicrobiaceae bacterium]|nr:DUF433 domain-containing protein [Acidimicrobiaceae bacterium]MYD05585.1 DUF433 domain-containing protein [Acidimicrobiaceae bacterium]MYI57611.1 DUF433 domain-containing protein [Acidimicrobiaceae bacterium]